MDHAIFAYSEITPAIYVGTNLCCSPHGAKLKELGVQIDISLEYERIEAPEGLGAFLWLPVRDHEAPTMEQLFVGTAVLAQAEERQIRAYVHCRNGHGRSPTLVIAHFIRHGMNAQTAHAFVQSKRPEINLTATQEAALAEFETRVRSH